jgi:hypothetical protein
MGMEEKARRRMALLAFGACALLGLAVYATVGRALVGDQFRVPRKGTAPRLHARSFSIRSSGEKLPALLPGSRPSPIALTLGNPNQARIFVIRLRVAVASSSLSCPSAKNLRILQSNTTRAHPIAIPAKSSVRLPAQGRSAPKIQLVDRPVNQDGCKRGRFSLRFSGRAYG